MSRRSLGLALFLAVPILLSLSVGCSNWTARGIPAAPLDAATNGSAEMSVETRVVEVACGQCQFGLPGDSCDLAVRFDGHAYFVEGTGIDDHGDAHADDGFCNAVRSAEVAGHVEGERYVVTWLRLLPSPE